MNEIVELILMSVLVAYSIFLTYPLAFRRISHRSSQFLTGIAVGVLIYLLMDIFSGTYPLLNNNIYLSLLLILPFVCSYFGFSLYSTSRIVGNNEKVYAETVSLIIALGIGLQNFTEGLAIGGSLKLGLSSVLIPLVVGLTLQNVTEGFPIVSPFFKTQTKISYSYLFYMYLIGGTPTLLGSFLSYYIASSSLVIVFNSIAMGGILFVIFEMYREIAKQNVTSLKHIAQIGIAIGISVAFFVNLLP